MITQHRTAPQIVMSIVLGTFLCVAPTLAFAATATTTAKVPAATTTKTVAKKVVAKTPVKTPVKTVTHAVTPTAPTGAACTFTRDLQLGMTGDDVKCLQKYLNSHGYTIAESGVGSAGHETGEFKALTEVALIKWQKANKLTPAIGYFGAQSRLFFKKGSASSVTGLTEPFLGAPLIQAPTTIAPASDAEAALRAQVEALKSVLEGRTNTLPVTTTTQTTVAATVVTPVATATAPAVSNDAASGDAAVRKVLDTVLNLVAKADTAIKKNSKNANISDAKDTILAAKDEILIALRAYIANDYVTAEATLGKAKKDATAAYTTANAGNQKQQATTAVADVQSNYKAAKTKITKADDAGKTVTSANRYMKKAANVLDDAQTALDDGKYADALDTAHTADSYVSDAVDAIGK